MNAILSYFPIQNMGRLVSASSGKGKGHVTVGKTYPINLLIVYQDGGLFSFINKLTKFMKLL